MNETIFLYKNKSVKTVKKFQKTFSKHHKDLKYILFPIDLYTDSFILHKPMEYMNHFTKAIIKFESVIIQSSYIMEDYGDCFSIISETTKEITDIVSFIQYLHSLNRIKYCNKLANTNESPVIERTEFTFFYLEIYNKDKIIFSLDMNLTNQKGEFGANEILEKISSIYHPLSLPSNYNYLEITDEWSFKNEISDNFRNLYGLYLPRTQSFTFFNKTGLMLLKSNVKEMYFYTATFNPEIIDEEECHDICSDPSVYFTDKSVLYTPMRFQDLWTHELPDIIEYITYLSYIHSNNIITSEVNDYGEPIHKYKAITNVEIISYDKSKNKNIECDSDHPFTINQLFEYFMS